MADWHTGGTHMSRSRSAPSLPDGHHDSRPFLESTKRPYGYYTSFIPEESPVSIKRPRHAVHLKPAFFTLREHRDSFNESGFNANITSKGPFISQPSLVDDVRTEPARNASSSESTPARGDESPHAPRMERTSSGLCMSSETSEVDDHPDDGGATMTDDEATRLVKELLADQRRRPRDLRGIRILRSLIRPNPSAEFDMDDNALRSIFSAANDIFFGGRLRGRVTWDWSDCSSARFQTKIIGTTALRKAAPEYGGYETLIVLSQHYLRNPLYNRRLLISTFLHELIHCYLFICCGFKARQCGGHTRGFRTIANLMDEWVGRDILFLRNMEADLGDFLATTEGSEHPTRTLHRGGRHCENHGLAPQPRQSQPQLPFFVTKTAESWPDPNQAPYKRPKYVPWTETTGTMRHEGPVPLMFLPAHPPISHRGEDWL